MQRSQYQAPRALQFALCYFSPALGCVYQRPLLLFSIFSQPNMDTSNSTYECSGVTSEQLDFFNHLSFWIGGIGQLVLCILGLAFNFIAIPVLHSKILFKSTFNRLLIVLAVFDNLYLCLAIFECIRRELDVSFEFHTTLFVNFLYPLHNIVLCLSIFMTVVLAKERFKAISDPIDYHAIMVSGRQWQRVFRYVLPVILVSVAFNMPKFFELKTRVFQSEDPDAPGNFTYQVLFEPYWDIFHFHRNTFFS